MKIDEDNMKAYDFGLRIKERRVMKNFSQKQLGGLLGVTKDTISKYESNVLTPSLDRIVKLARILDVSLDYLMGIESIPTIKLYGLTQEQCEWLIQTVKLLRAANELMK